MKYELFVNPLFTQSILKKISMYSPRAYVKLRIAKWLKKLSEEIKDYEEARKHSLEKHAKRDDNGEFIYDNTNGQKNYTFNDEGMKAFESEHKELLQTEFELPELRASWIQEPLTANELMFMLDYVADDIKDEETQKA